MEIAPLNDYLVLKVADADKDETVMESGIIIPKSADIEQPDIGTVMKVGPSVKTKRVKEGDTVLFKRHLFDEVKYGGSTYYFGKEANLFAVLHD